MPVEPYLFKFGASSTHAYTSSLGARNGTQLEEKGVSKYCFDSSTIWSLISREMDCTCAIASTLDKHHKARI